MGDDNKQGVQPGQRLDVLQVRGWGTLAAWPQWGGAAKD